MNKILFFSVLIMGFQLFAMTTSIQKAHVAVASVLQIDNFVAAAEKGNLKDVQNFLKQFPNAVLKTDFRGKNALEAIIEHHFQGPPFVPDNYMIFDCLVKYAVHQTEFEAMRAALEEKIQKTAEEGFKRSGGFWLLDATHWIMLLNSCYNSHLAPPYPAQLDSSVVNVDPRYTQILKDALDIQAKGSEMEDHATDINAHGQSFEFTNLTQSTLAVQPVNAGSGTSEAKSARADFLKEMKHLEDQNAKTKKEYERKSKSIEEIRQEYHKEQDQLFNQQMRDFDIDKGLDPYLEEMNRLNAELARQLAAIDNNVEVSDKDSQDKESLSIVMLKKEIAEARMRVQATEQAAKQARRELERLKREDK